MWANAAIPVQSVPHQSLFPAQGKLDEAEVRFREALASFRGTLGAAHPSYVGCAGNLASLLHAQGRASEAAPLLREVVEAHRSTVGVHSALYLSAANQLGSCLADMKEAATADTDTAEVLLRAAAAGLSGLHGSDGIDGLAAVLNLESLLLDLGSPLDLELVARTAEAKARKGSIPGRRLRLRLRVGNAAPGHPGSVQGS